MLVSMQFSGLNIVKKIEDELSNLKPKSDL